MAESGDRFFEAKMKELESWRANNVYDVVDQESLNFIGVRWVLTEKNGVEKARLVAKGYQDKNAPLDKSLVDSPTCSKESVRTILNVMAVKSWTPHSLDVKSAFLQGQPIKRDIYLKPPPEAEAKNKLWKLNKCVYGLDEASRYWYLRVKTLLLSLGLELSPFDNCVFLLKNQGDLVGVLGLHVDDFIWGGDHNFGIVIGELRNVLSVGSENVGSFTFLGLEITFSENTVWLSQSGFIRGIEEMPDTEFSDGSRTSVRNLLGKLQWVASQTRPDLCYRICFYLCCLDKLELSHIRALNKIVRQLRFEKNLRIGLRSITNWNDAKILLFTDASLANNSDMSTQGGCIVGLSDRNNVISPLAWHSRKLKRVVHSTLGAELLALVDGLDVCINLSEQLNFYLGKNIRIKVLIDNKSLKD